MAAAQKTLVIVESPSKAKTIGRYLGSKYKVVASVGHVRDLPKSKLGIDIENDFEPQYISIRGKGDLIKNLKKDAKDASKVLLATDPDREGEAIAWHLAYLLGLDEKSKCRIEFHEITKNAILSAVKEPRPINLSLVDAQQARRVLDRLVGYQLSPLLWRKIRKGLSAGRVQSAALKMICDREKQIRDFVPEEYWTITALLEAGGEFEAKLNAYKGKKLEIRNKEQADSILAELRDGKYIVKELEEKQRSKKPYAPFTTSSLQQDASNKLNFQARRTMRIAQELYEGVDIKGSGTTGLITYIRTDSVRVSAEAVAAAKEYIVGHFGEKYAGNNFYSNKKKDVQDAHEAIRPSHIELEPEAIKASLTRDQYMLYKLIWSRFMASRMASAVFDTVSADIANGDYNFHAAGSKLAFDGYLKLYKDGSADDGNKLLPPLKPGQEAALKSIAGEQSFTQPPARFTEASFVKELEEKDIGRPSTYATIVATLIDRKYVERQKKTLLPTELGFVVTDMTSEYFKDIVDVGFTAEMEDKLDDVELSKRRWREVIGDFYGPFKEELDYADSKIEHVKLEDKVSDEVCELCGRPMVYKTGRFGDFLACSGYPECKNTKPIVKTTGVPCPLCGKDIVARRSKKGKIFYGCSGYPNCTQVYWDKPVNKKCPNCGSLLVEKRGRAKGLKCSNSECGYSE